MGDIWAIPKYPRRITSLVEVENPLQKASAATALGVPYTPEPARQEGQCAAVHVLNAQVWVNKALEDLQK